MTTSIIEPERRTPVWQEADICVLGGSCTGVFAAIAAARLGARVVVVEKMNCFGGVATSGLVNIWHSLYDTEGTRQIIAGLTTETVERLQRRQAIEWYTRDVPQSGMYFNTEELKIELDEMVLDAGVTPMLHTSYVAPYVSDGALRGVVVENKSGRGAILARYFIDATGDGDLCAHLQLPSTTFPLKQPPSTCAKIYNFTALRGINLYELLVQYGKDYNLPEGFAWYAPIPGMPELRMLAGSRVYGVDCADGDDLTRAEIEGRRQVRALLDIIRAHTELGDKITLAGLSSYIGIRETRHIHCRYRLQETEILAGTCHADAIANGSYRVDIHHDNRPGVTFRYLDGREVYARMGFPNVERRWRPETAENPTFYQIPYRALIPDSPYLNLLLCGRPLDADRGAFGAIRVMVNTNQTGQAAGAAAALALQADGAVDEVDAEVLRKTLRGGGAMII